jgi:phage baseplate assembly protein gpV
LVGIVEAIQTVSREELKKIHIMEIGIVTSVFPHSSGADKDNYECNVKLRDTEMELRKVPVATQHVGLSNIVHVNDQVLVSFINGDINSPVVIGRLYNDEDRPPLSKMEEIVYKPEYTKDDNLRRLNIVLPQEVVNLHFYDNKVSLIVGKSSVKANSEGMIEIKSFKNKEQEAQGGTEILMNNSNYKASAISRDNISTMSMGDTGNILIQANAGGKVCEITMSGGGIDIATDSNIRVKTKGNLEIECDGDYSLKARKVKIESVMDTKIRSGSTLDQESTTTMTIKSKALANIESKGPMAIKGAVVGINS